MGSKLEEEEEEEGECEHVEDEDYEEEEEEQQQTHQSDGSGRARPCAIQTTNEQLESGRIIDHSPRPVQVAPGYMQQASSLSGSGGSGASNCSTATSTVGSQRQLVGARRSSTLGRRRAPVQHYGILAGASGGVGRSRPMAAAAAATTRRLQFRDEPRRHYDTDHHCLAHEAHLAPNCQRPPATYSSLIRLPDAAELLPAAVQTSSRGLYTMGAHFAGPHQQEPPGRLLKSFGEQVACGAHEAAEICLLPSSLMDAIQQQQPGSLVGQPLQELTLTSSSSPSYSMMIDQHSAPQPLVHYLPQTDGQLQQNSWAAAAAPPSSACQLAGLRAKNCSSSITSPGVTSTSSTSIGTNNVALQPQIVNYVCMPHSSMVDSNGSDEPFSLLLAQQPQLASNLQGSANNVYQLEDALKLLETSVSECITSRTDGGHSSAL